MERYTFQEVLGFFIKRKYPIIIKNRLPKYNQYIHLYRYLHSRETIRSYPYNILELLLILPVGYSSIKKLTT